MLILRSGLIKSIDINETDEYGYTGLHLASEHGHLKVVEELMVGIGSGIYFCISIDLS